MLTEGQVQVGDLVMGRGTPYQLRGFNPWSRTVRADQTDERAWGHGSWSGAEWQAQAVVPMTIRVLGTDAASWMQLHFQLSAAFAASHEDIELRWVTGGVEYLMFGRPRMVDPEIETLGRGEIVTKAAFAALDPAIYSGEEHSVTLGLPSTSGGLQVPLKAPLQVAATVTSGRALITNAGTRPAALRLRIDGPVPNHRVSLLTDDGTQMLRVWMPLLVNQWLSIDTGSRTVYMNDTASRRGKVTADGIGWPVLPGGTHEIAFDADSYNAAARLTVSWRDAWK